MAEIIGRVGWRNFVPTENPLWDNLKAYYTGDNTANDAKGTYNGTLVNGATYGTGKIGSGFSLDGINDYVGFSSTWFRKSKTEPFTISSWVNSSVHYGAIFSNGVDDGHLAFIYGQYIYLQMGAGLYGSIRVVSASTIPLNTFKHITITYNGNCTLSGFKIYIDGVSVGVNIAQGEYGPLNNLASNDTPAIASIPRIGARCDGAYPFAGVLDEVGIWDRALTGAEVTELYNVGAGKQYVAPAPTIVTNSNTFPTSNLFAYSFRKVVPTATLSFRVRRSSDNAEQNIGFVGNDLDTASLLSFVGAGNGFVVKMYNQVSSTSTAGNDLVQTYASAQFQIVVSGVVNTLNGKPSCTTGNGKYMLTTTLFNPSVITGTSIFSVTKPIGQIGGDYSVDWIYSIGNGSLGTDRFLDHHISGASGNPTTYNQSVQSALSNISTTYTSGTKFQSHLIKSGNNKYYQNNVLVGSNTTALVTPGSGHRLVINNISWSFGTTSFANQYFSEILVYNSDETSNLETIHNNISSYYTPSIVTTGLVMNLDAGNTLSYAGTGTTWTDLSGNGNNGTLINGTSYSSTNGGTLVFDGINDYVSLTNNNLPMGTSDFTWSVWFKTPSTFSSWQMLLTTSQYYAYFGSLNGNLRLDFDGPAGVFGLSPNTWYNMVIIRVSGTGGIKAYANGTYLGGINTNNISLTGNMNIGNWAYNNSLSWLGNISNVQIYNRALAQSEVTNNFDALKSRYGL